MTSDCLQNAVTVFCKQYEDILWCIPTVHPSPSFPSPPHPRQDTHAQKTNVRTYSIGIPLEIMSFRTIIIYFVTENTLCQSLSVTYILPYEQNKYIYSKIPMFRPPLGLSKSGLKDHFWTAPKVVSNQMYTGCRKWRKE